MKSLLIIFLLGISFNSFGKVKIFTTTTNLADLVRQVGGDHVKVESLCKGTQDPHYLEAKPSYTFKLSKADLLVSVGAGLEDGWLPLVIRGSRNPKLRVGQTGHFVASDALELLEVDAKKISRSQGDVHPEGNPHFMLSPVMALEVAKAITVKLSELDSEHREIYNQNLNVFTKKIKKMLITWKKKMGENRKVVSYHKTLTYFYHDFGIENIDVLEPKPGIPPTASHVINIIRKIRKNNVKKIIVENYFDDTVARRIQKEVSLVKVEVVPVAVFGKVEVTDLIQLYQYLVDRIGD